MDTIVNLLRLLHSWNRWFVLAAAVAVIVLAVVGLAQRRAFKPSGESSLKWFTRLLDVQWLLGLLMLIFWGSITGFGVRHYWEHLVVTTLAVGVASMAPRLYERRSLSDTDRYRANIGVIVVVVLLVVVGIFALPDAIQWRFFVPA